MVTYLGSGPYCYAHSLSMILGPAAPPAGVIETLTGSPFGMQLIGGTRPFFDPYGWDPEIGLDAAIELLGWECERTYGGTAEEALERLRGAGGPVLVGPVDMGALPYLPHGEGDHYLVVLSVAGGVVVVHDPQGHPFATLPEADFLAAWRGEAVEYLEVPYVLRSRFTRVREVSAEDALRRSLPAAVRWLDGRDDVPVPPGTLGGGAAALRLAELAEGGFAAEVRDLLVYFGVRLGARRLADAATCLASLGLTQAAAVAEGQAREIGALQHPLVTGDDTAVATGLRRLAPGYALLQAVLDARPAAARSVAAS